MDSDTTLTFSVAEQYDYQDLIEEAIETIRSADTELGPQQGRTDVAVEELVASLRKLEEEKAFFAKNLTVQRLSLDDFKARKLKPSPGVQKWLLTQGLYLIQVPITLKPASGWTFTHLECGVAFEGTPSAPEVKVHDIYPEDVWREILHLRTHLKLGLDAELNFRAEVAPTEFSLQKLSGQARARLTAEAGGGTQLAFGPFNHTISRPQVRARGRENTEVFWTLHDQKYVAREEPYLAVVLRVPNEVQSVNAMGQFIVYHRIGSLSALLAGGQSVFREKLHAFLGKGLPLKKAAIWHDIIP